MKQTYCFTFKNARDVAGIPTGQAWDTFTDEQKDCFNVALERRRYICSHIEGFLMGVGKTSDVVFLSDESLPNVKLFLTFPVCPKYWGQLNGEERPVVALFKYLTYGSNMYQFYDLSCEVSND